MPAWPASLPQAPLIGLEEEPPDTTLRTKMDAGPDKTRPRFTAGVRNFSWPIRLTDTQKTTFDDFFINDLARGALAFTHINPTTKAVVSFRLTARPKYKLIGPTKWVVTLALEILP